MNLLFYFSSIYLFKKKLRLKIIYQNLIEIERCNY